MLPKLLTAREIAEILGLEVSTIYKYSMAGKLPVVKINGALRFDPSEIEKYIEQNSKPSLQVIAS